MVLQAVALDALSAFLTKRHLQDELMHVNFDYKACENEPSHDSLSRSPMQFT